jgi:hypothetical protein
MKTEQNRTGRAGRPESLTTSARWIAKGRLLVPHAVAGLLRAQAFRYWQVVLVIAGLVVQAVLTMLMWQLIDLSVSLMEVWAELARKHLEIVLAD